MIINVSNLLSHDNLATHCINIATSRNGQYNKFYLNSKLNRVRNPDLIAQIIETNVFSDNHT